MIGVLELTESPTIGSLHITFGHFKLRERAVCISP